MDIKKSVILMLMILTANCVEAKKDETFTIQQGDPLILLQPKKTAILEIDYSKLMVTDGKNHEDDIDYITWMKMQDEDDNKWVNDWENKDKEECYKSFRDNFNKEIDDAIKLTKYGKDYKMVLTMKTINFGSAVKYSIVTGWKKGQAKGGGELEVRDLNTDELLLLIEFNDLKGEGSFKQIGRFKGIYENLCEKLNQYLEEYQKEQKKLAKKNKKKD